jgi:hypothetical protein
MMQTVPADITANEVAAQRRVEKYVNTAGSAEGRARR